MYFVPAILQYFCDNVQCQKMLIYKAFVCFLYCFPVWFILGKCVCMNIRFVLRSLATEGERGREREGGGGVGGGRECRCFLVLT